MNPATKKNHKQLILSGLIFLSPVLSLSVWSGYTFANLGMLVYFVFILFSNKQYKSVDIESKQEWSKIKTIAWTVWIYCAISLSIDIYFHNPVGSLEVYIPFLLMPSCFWLFKRISVEPDWLWLGAAVGAVLGALTAYYQIELGADRAHGYHSSAISFGNTGVLFASASLIGLFYSGRFSTRWQWRAVMWLGFVSGLATSMLSGSKGGWLSILTLMIFALVILSKTFSGRQKTIAFIMTLAALSFLLAMPSNPVFSRLQSAYHGLSSWIETGRVSVNEGSVGPRLSMWKFGFSVIHEKPIIGFGQNALETRWQQAIDQGQADPGWGPKGSLHNELLTVYLWRGSVGLAALLAVYIVAFRYFWRNRNHPSKEVQGVAITGMFFITLYLEFGLSDVIWPVNANRQIFMFWLVVLVGLLYSLLKKQNAHNLSQ